METRSYSRLELEPIRFAKTHRIDRMAAAGMRKLEHFEKFEDIITQELRIEMERLVYSDCLRDETVTVVAEVEIPSSWWQHFKQDAFPAWLLRRFPVKTTKITKTNSKLFRAMALFPDFCPQYPEDIGKPVFHVIQR